MRKALFIALVAIILFNVTGCATGPQLTSLQRRVIESKEFEGTFDDVFKSTVAVLQDKGYRIRTSDYNGGMIYAGTERGPCIPCKGSYQYDAIINIEKFTDKRTKIRISLTRDIRDLWGNPWNPPLSNIKPGPVQEPEIYQDLYAEIQKEIFRKAQLNR